MKFIDRGGGEDTKDLIKLKDTESIRGVFYGDPKTFDIHWGASRSEPCTGIGCKACAAGNKAGFRFKINFLIKDELGGFTAKVFEQGWTFYCAIRDMHIDNGGDYDLEKTLVRVTRRGVGKNDTTYSIVPVPNSALTPETVAKLKQVKLHTFGLGIASPTPLGSPPAPDGWGGSNGTTDPGPSDRDRGPDATTTADDIPW